MEYSARLIPQAKQGRNKSPTIYTGMQDTNFKKRKQDSRSYSPTKYTSNACTSGYIYTLLETSITNKVHNMFIYFIIHIAVFYCLCRWEIIINFVIYHKLYTCSYAYLVVPFGTNFSWKIRIFL